MKATDAIVSMLMAQGVKYIFGYTGGSIADLIDSIYKFSPAINFVENRHEQAAAFAANAYASVTGNLGVAISSSGPGAINLLSGIANAYYDSVPCLFITGNVHSMGRKKNENKRQNAFQETDIISMAEKITKACFYVENEESIQDVVNRAIRIARTGRQGPVLIDIPYDIQRKNVVIKNDFVNEVHESSKSAFKPTMIKEIMGGAKRPIILVGGGCQSKRESISKIIESWHIPIVTSMRGVDVIPHDNKYHVGVIGSYGNRYANLALRYSDCIIVLGSRLDERQIGYKKNDFAPQARIIQIDIDEYELGEKVLASLEINDDVENFCKQINGQISCYVYDDWMGIINRWKNRYSSVKSNDSRYMVNKYLNMISSYADDDAIFTVDVGLNQVCSMQSLYLRGGMRFLSSSGLGAMGYSLPAAIGAFYASKRQIISINGDGGLQMNIQELQTIRHFNIPIKIVVINNYCLGMIHSLQSKLFENRYCASIDDYSTPKWEAIAKAFDIRYLLIKNECCSDDMRRSLDDNEPIIIEVMVDETMSPNPDAGCDISSQIPLLGTDELKKINADLRSLE